ncbi:hypothetical protein [uncultured Shewanella sp.]|uniref:DUF6892 domain-containing protein n=1 Tax=uncultured Shewanella sp. TaxID=173975 RepID=UPI0026288106|nr:hypothetical protein [uncultured Shewanella sp.]
MSFHINGIKIPTMMLNKSMKCEAVTYFDLIDGPERQLNFAIKTSIKKTIRVLEQLTLDSDRLPFEDTTLIIKQLFGLAATISVMDKKSTALIRSIGNFLLKVSRSKSGAEYLFHEWSIRLLSIDYNSQPQCQIAYQWLLLLEYQYGNSISSHALKIEFDGSEDVLNQIWFKLFALINENNVFYDRKGEQPGVKLLELFSDLYYYYSNTCSCYVESWIVACITRELNFGGHETLSLLQRSDNHPRIAANLLNLYFTSQVGEIRTGLSQLLISNLFNIEQYPTDVLNTIIGYLAPMLKEWNTGQLNDAISALFPMEGDEKSKTKHMLIRSKGASKLARLLVDQGKGELVDTLILLLKSELTPKYKLPVEGVGQFIDINVKLLVVEELMFVQGLLTPIFNLQDFIQNFDHREITFTGYDIIPEAIEYMKGIKIPEELMSCVTELTYDPSNEIYSQLVPYWDGEDGIFEPLVLDDLNMMENIKIINGFSQALINANQIMIKNKKMVVNDTF